MPYIVALSKDIQKDIQGDSRDKVMYIKRSDLWLVKASLTHCVHLRVFNPMNSKIMIRLIRHICPVTTALCVEYITFLQQQYDQIHLNIKYVYYGSNAISQTVRGLREQKRGLFRRRVNILQLCCNKTQLLCLEACGPEAPVDTSMHRQVLRVPGCDPVASADCTPLSIRAVEERRSADSEQMTFNIVAVQSWVLSQLNRMIRRRWGMRSGQPDWQYPVRVARNGGVAYVCLFAYLCYQKWWIKTNIKTLRYCNRQYLQFHVTYYSHSYYY